MLEPSPPAVNAEPWYADDPTARDEVPAGRELVSPVSTGDLRWDDLASDDPDLSEFCAERWLGAYRRLEAPPDTFASTRLALHRLAGHVVSPIRQRANGKIGLRFTRGGFGTPFFGADAQVRVEGAELIVHGVDGERRAVVTTIEDAAKLIGFDLTGLDLEQGGAALDVDEDAARRLGDWFGFSTSVLEELRARARPEHEPSRVQLWPEHFDVALELGSEGAARRAAFGGSPGDDVHAEPYLYVAPWTARPTGELWRAEAFPGAELPLAELLAAGDQRAAALEFFETRVAALHE